MTLKDKLIFIVLSIITLGIFLIVVFAKKNKKQKNELSVSKKISFDVKKLVELLGTKGNIEGAIYTHTKVKIHFSDRSKVDAKNIKNRCHLILTFGPPPYGFDGEPFPRSRLDVGEPPSDSILSSKSPMLTCGPPRADESIPAFPAACSVTGPEVTTTGHSDELKRFPKSYSIREHGRGK